MSDFLDFIDDDDEDEEEDEEVIPTGACRDEVEGTSVSEPVAMTEEQQAHKLQEQLSNRPAACGVLQFHNGIEESLLLTIERNSNLLTASDVVHAVDQFCYSRHWMMHIGPVKGKILDDVILQAQGSGNKKLVCVELGSYCGYSTIRIASQFKNPDSMVYTIEREPKCCAWTRRLCKKAQVISSVSIIEGGIETGIESLVSKNLKIDVLFIDHEKLMYLNDLKLFEASGLLSPGTIVVADNILSFGVPLSDYLNHVRMPSAEGGLYSSSVLHRRSVEYSTATDSVEDGSELEDGIEISYFA